MSPCAVLQKQVLEQPATLALLDQRVIPESNVAVFDRPSGIAASAPFNVD
jgi:hypothetical protein